MSYTLHPRPLSSGGKIHAIIRCPSPDGYKTRAARLADAIAHGRYSHRQGGYIMSIPASKRFEALYAQGADASSFTGAIYS